MTTETLPPRNSAPTAPAFDPRPLFAAAVRIADPVIAGVRPEQLDRPSPCVDFDVRGLLDHLVFVLHRVAAIGRGDEAFAAGSLGDTKVEHSDWAADWRSRAADVEAAWADPTRLTDTVVLPWATMTGAETLATYVAEITTHTWDVATATGQRAEWDDEVCQVALDTMRRELPMADRTPMWEAFRATAPANFQFDAPFANAVAVAADAPLIDQLVAWTGRRP
jgi:uncharacterized protein (TIGR03086 family)